MLTPTFDLEPLLSISFVEQMKSAQLYSKIKNKPN